MNELDTLKSIAASLNALIVAKEGAPAVPVAAGPNLAGFLAARSKTPPEDYPSIEQYAYAQRDDRTNNLTDVERATITYEMTRIWAYPSKFPPETPYAVILYRYLHPDAYNPRTGQPWTQAERNAEAGVTDAWDRHWEAKKPKPAPSAPQLPSVGEG